MEKYSSYKDSGVQWLGEIPSHWDMLRWRYILEENKTKNFSCKERLQLQFNYGNIIPKTEQSEEGDVLETISKYTVVSPDDIMINGLNLNYDFISQRVALVKQRGVITSAYISLHPIGKAYSKYYAYFLKSMDAKKMFHGMGTGIRLTLSNNELKNQFIPFPPPSEQQLMAAYLDNVTADIDKAIAQQQRMIDLLNERKRIIIQHAVTKGLNDNVEMKDSGIEWIGEIPAHWEIRRIKSVAQLILGKMLSSQGGNVSEYCPYICAKDVHFGSVDISDLKMMYFSDNEKKRYAVNKGDLLVVEGGAGAGGCAVVEQEIVDTYIQNSIIAIRSNKDMYNLYISFVLEAFVKRGLIECVCNKATIPHFTKEKVGATYIPIPTKGEQEQIVNHLNEVNKNTQIALNSHQQLINLLQERKQIIISEVVTGKIKVS